MERPNLKKMKRTSWEFYYETIKVRKNLKKNQFLPVKIKNL